MLKNKDYYYQYYCFIYSQKELSFTNSCLLFFKKKAINSLFKPAQKN